MIIMKVNVLNFMEGISKAQHVINEEVGRHQQQVAFLSYCLAKKLRFSHLEIERLVVAGLCHDIGALSLAEQKIAIKGVSISINSHAFRGAYLMERYMPELEISNIIKYHHYNWDNGNAILENPDMPIQSGLVHLADRVCSKILATSSVLTTIDEIKQYVENGRGKEFSSEHVDAFHALADQEWLWLGLISDNPVEKIDKDYFSCIEVDIERVVNWSKLYSQIIDFRSPFTATHSASVAITAMKLAELMNFSSKDCKKMLAAGYLHDLGKLTVDNLILEKDSSLTKDEFAVIRTHTYYTYYLLDEIYGMGEIKEWAAYHHEKINGNGYPFHLAEPDLSLGARIMAVADVFSALTEERPYKKALSKEEVTEILNKMVKNLTLDGNIVAVLEENFDLLTQNCFSAKVSAIKEYEMLYSIS